MKKITALLVLLGLLLMGCGSIGNKIGKAKANLRNGNFTVKLYSGGTVAREWKVKGYINSEEHSDGWFWFEGNRLIRVSGTITIEED